MLQAASPPLVLASASASRRALLASAGLQFEAVVTGVDEDGFKAAATGVPPEDLALQLARLKARSVRHADAIVIGCDQILVCDGVLYDKPPTMDAAREHLRALRGRTHTLVTATVALQGGKELWHHLAMPRLTMRPFTDMFLEAYLDSEGPAVLTSVGAYRLEGLGAHLFEHVDGEHSAILGLPLLPLLGFLRSFGILPV